MNCPSCYTYKIHLIVSRVKKLKFFVGLKMFYKTHLTAFVKTKLTLKSFTKYIYNIEYYNEF